MTHDVRILLIDDDVTDAHLTREALFRSDESRYQIDTATSLAEARLRLDQAQYDLVLLDLNLPETTGLDTLRKLKELVDEDVSVIVLTGMEDDDKALEMLGEGAADYICKNDVRSDTISRSVEYTLRRQSLLVELQAANKLLKEKNSRLAKLYATAQQFVDNVSHEFRTPLTVIREFSSIIRDGLVGPVTEKQSHHLEKILHRTDDLSLMVDDMLDISKLEAGLLAVWRRPCQAAELIANVESTIQGRADSRKITFTTEIASNLPDVYCDEEKARRVIINLAINAVKFTPEGGTVKLWARKKGDDVQIGVADSGPGISAENLQEIFGRFRQVDTGIHCSTKGFGLGLNIAKELVRLNLGQIDVASTPGHGSTFSFTLPLHDLSAVVQRFLTQFEALNPEGSELSLVTARVDSETDSGPCEVVDEFLQRALRGNDLAIRAGQRRWLLIVAGPRQEIQDATGRIEADWRCFARNCPAVELPELKFDEIGSWSMPGQTDAFRAALRAANLPTAGSNEEEDAADGAKVPSRPPRVLVVDDNPDVSSCLSVRLEAAGYEVMTAFDGEEGLTSALENLPDAVVLDVQMPKRDGLSVLRELRADARTKNTAIVMLSASVRDQHGALESGANFFVQKPYESRDVLTAIETSMTHRKN